MKNLNGMDDVASLKLRLEILSRRVEELESENRFLLSRISGCSQCSKIPASHVADITSPAGSALSVRTLVKATSNSDFHDNETEKQRRHSTSDSYAIHSKVLSTQVKEEVEQFNGIKYGTGEEVSGCQLRTLCVANKRYIALKIMYFGQRFYGFASEAHMDPTIESEIFKALEKTKLLVSNRKNSNYSRCGRTDKGVSSTGQVIALYLRSKVKDTNLSEEIYEKEIDYVKVLNRALPKDIRVIGWCPVSTNFHSRFSCLGREYKYFFWRGKLDIMAMQTAGKKLIGEHDFRNFCKMDAANVSNYMRRIIFFEISSCMQSSEDDELYAMTIQGSAFLWHQVRCMVAVLFIIGQGLELPTIIDMLLDTHKISRKPQYAMAPDLPLVLRSCEFKDINFHCSSEASQALVDDLKSMVKTYKLQAAIFHEALSLVPEPRESLLECCNKKRCYVPLILRPTEHR